MVECKILENRKKCNCTYSGCDLKGMCCKCLEFHLKQRQLPACCFPNDVEKTFDRSFEKFAELVENKQI